MKSFEWAIWETEAPDDPKIELVDIDHFSALGMLRVYGRCDRFRPRHTFNMDVWLTRSGRLFARFWSRSRHVDWRSLEVVGFSRPFPPVDKKAGLDDQWIPERLRDEYDDWIDDETMEIP